MVTGFNYFPQSAGGAESSTHELCLALKNEDHQVAVLAALMAKTDPTYVRNRLISKLTGNPAPTDKISGYPVYRAWSAVESLEQVCDDFKPDIVMVQSGEPAKLTNASLALGFPTVLYLRDTNYHSHGGSYHPDRNLHVIANSNFTSRKFRETFGIDSTVVPPAINPARYHVPEKKRISDSVLFINPHPAKGVETAIGLARLNPEIPFIFQEAWQLEASLKQDYLDKISDMKNIEWRKRQKDMRETYSRARVVIIPSIWEEAWCRVASESHVNGIPVIARNIGGLPESVGPGGILIDREAGIKEWNDALHALWYDDTQWRHYSNKAKEYSARDELRLMSTNTKVITLLESLLLSLKENRQKEVAARD